MVIPSFTAPGYKRALALSFSIVLTTIGAVAQDFILLTEGGGVTGNTTVFRISRSGEVAKGTGIVEPQYSEFAQLRKLKTNKFFRKTHALLEKRSFNYPGNMYKAIALQEDGKETKLVWGDPAYQPSRDAKKLYQKMQASLNRLTFTKELRK